MEKNLKVFYEHIYSLTYKSLLFLSLFSSKPNHKMSSYSRDFFLPAQEREGGGTLKEEIQRSPMHSSSSNI